MEQPTEESLLTFLRQQYENKGIEIGDWNRAYLVYGFGNATSALLHSVLFAPEFVEIAGCIFLRDFGNYKRDELAAKVAEARKKSVAELQRLVWSYTWLEVGYVINDRMSGDEQELLANLIADAWRLRLKGKYPDRRFVVSVMSEEEGSGGGGGSLCV